MKCVEISFLKVPPSHSNMFTAIDHEDRLAANSNKSQIFIFLIVRFNIYQSRSIILIQARNFCELFVTVNFSVWEYNQGQKRYSVLKSLWEWKISFLSLLSTLVYAESDSRTLLELVSSLLDLRYKGATCLSAVWNEITRYSPWSGLIRIRGFILPCLRFVTVWRKDL